MASTSAEALARRILNCVAAGGDPPGAEFQRLLDLAAACDPECANAVARALFGILAEGLSDPFEPRLTGVYVRLFAQAIERIAPEYDAAGLMERYRRVRCPRRWVDGPDSVRDVIVLSRVTLGADIAVTSVLLDAVKQRFPEARIHLAGSQKNWELFADDPRIAHLPLSYGRNGSLAGRIAAGLALKKTLSRPGVLVIDPDSRITQLGLLPVCPEENYLFFESRCYGLDGDEPLSELARRWAAEILGVPDAKPFIRPAAKTVSCAGDEVTISFGVGENPAKRIDDPFEEELLRHLVARGQRLLVDTGAGGDERERVRRAAARSGAKPEQLELFEGPFAEFAAHIAQSRLYIGYDSAGQHAAAACGVPLITLFAGFASARAFARWQPSGPGPKIVLRVETPDPQAMLRDCVKEIDRLLPGIPAL